MRAAAMACAQSHSHALKRSQSLQETQGGSFTVPATDAAWCCLCASTLTCPHSRQGLSGVIISVQLFFVQAKHSEVVQTTLHMPGPLNWRAEVLPLRQCLQLIAAAQSHLAISAVPRRAWQAGGAIPGSIIVHTTSCTHVAASRGNTPRLAWHAAPLSWTVAGPCSAWRRPQCYAAVVTAVWVCFTYSLVGRRLTPHPAGRQMAGIFSVRHHEAWHVPMAGITVMHLDQTSYSSHRTLD
jgi:hypothetical protein